MRVEYQVGMTVFRDWVCLQHENFARSKAETWWRRRNNGPVPRNVSDALEMAEYVLIKPSHIRVKKEGKYDRITAYRFDEMQAQNAA
jgi:DNA repair protein RadD